MPQGDSPWGVAVDSTSQRVYVAGFSSGDLCIFTSALGSVATVDFGTDAQLTDVATSNGLGLALVASHHKNTFYVVNGLTGGVEALQPTGGLGAWGVAYNLVLNRAYVSHRDTGSVTTLDGGASWTQRYGQTIQPCGAGGQPYGLGFNPMNQCLYIACAPHEGTVNVHEVMIYTATSDGLRVCKSITSRFGRSPTEPTAELIHLRALSFLGNVPVEGVRRKQVEQQPDRAG